MSGSLADGEVVGQKHPSYALSLNNLANLHKDSGDYRTALPLYQQALSLRKEVLGEKHPHYASSLNNLAGLHLALRDYRAALPLSAACRLLPAGRHRC